MINKKYLKNLRCKEINNKNDFIFDLYSERLIDALEIIKLNFKNILILGDKSIKLEKYLSNRFNDSIITIYGSKYKNFNKTKLSETYDKSYYIDLWKEHKNKYDLILSNFFLNITEDLENVFKKIMLSLNPNGLLLATLPDPKSFDLLRYAMIKTDSQIYGGAYNRFNKIIKLENIIDYMKNNNFKIPIVNSEKISL